MNCPKCRLYGLVFEANECASCGTSLGASPTWFDIGRNAVQVHHCRASLTLFNRFQVFAVSVTRAVNDVGIVQHPETGAPLQISPQLFVFLRSY